MDALFRVPAFAKRTQAPLQAIKSFPFIQTGVMATFQHFNRWLPGKIYIGLLSIHLIDRQIHFHTTVKPRLAGEKLLMLGTTEQREAFHQRFD
jgi:hypothetical protein